MLAIENYDDPSLRMHQDLRYVALGSSVSGGFWDRGHPDDLESTGLVSCCEMADSIHSSPSLIGRSKPDELHFTIEKDKAWRDEKEPDDSNCFKV